MNRLFDHPFSNLSKSDFYRLPDDSPIEEILVSVAQGRSVIVNKHFSKEVTVIPSNSDMVFIDDYFYVNDILFSTSKPIATNPFNVISVAHGIKTLDCVYLTNKDRTILKNIFLVNNFFSQKVVQKN